MTQIRICPLYTHKTEDGKTETLDAVPLLASRRAVLIDMKVVNQVKAFDTTRALHFAKTAMSVGDPRVQKWIFSSASGVTLRKMKLCSDIENPDEQALVIQVHFPSLKAVTEIASENRSERALGPFGFEGNTFNITVSPAGQKLLDQKFLEEIGDICQRRSASSGGKRQESAVSQTLTKIVSTPAVQNLVANLAANISQAFLPKV